MTDPTLRSRRRGIRRGIRHGVRHGVRRGAERIDAAAPAHRDRAVDALRALAVLGVVLGHWLVTALVADGRTLRTASPLQHLPWLTPVSWLFQTLAVFFLVGGHVATRSHASARARGIPYHRWLRGRLARLFKPVAAVLSLWTVVAVALLLSGTEYATVRTLVKLALSPLWFLLVFAALTAATPLLARLHPLWPLAVVLHVDLLRFGFGGSAWLGWINLAAGWLVPYTLGAAWTRESWSTAVRAGSSSSPVRRPRPRSSPGPATPRRWSASRVPPSPTSTRRRWPPSPSAWPSADWRCCCANGCGVRCGGRSSGRRWRWSTSP